MNTRRLRLVRPRWTLGTMLLVVGWSAVVVWLNVRPRVRQWKRYLPDGLEPLVIDHVAYGYPWTCADRESVQSTQIPSRRFGSITYWKLVPGSLPDEETIHYWPLTANIAIGLVAVAVLTFASKYLIRAIVAGLRAFMSKPPPDKQEGD